MIETPTVLILGAGASAAYGYPVGRKLRDEVKTNLLPKSQKFSDLLNLGHSIDQISKFRDRLSDSRLYSMDIFLDGHREYSDIAKLAIAQVLTAKELADVYDCNENADWYGYLCNSLHTPTHDEFLENALSIITFNYDRSLEQYLFKALGNFYNVDSADLVKTIPIVHMYGKLDNLPMEAWEKGTKREYGSIPKGKSLIESSNGIKLIYESKTEGTFVRAHKLLEKAERVYFLGFGYDKTNLDNLKIIESFLNKNVGNKTYNREALGTCFGLSDSKKNSVRTYHNGITLDNYQGDCYEFLNRYGL